MSSSPTPTSTVSSSSSGSTLRSRKVLIPKVWKRPHSTIYGKNVEFGSSLYSDKIGELNGRRFNSELPWSVRNSGGNASLAGSSSSAGGSGYNQGYLSNLLTDPASTSLVAGLGKDSGSGSGNYNSNSAAHSSCTSYADLLELTNPSRNSRRHRLKRPPLCPQRLAALVAAETAAKSGANSRIDFYDQYMDLNKEIDHLHNSSLLMNEPLLTRKAFDHFLDFDNELGLFVPSYDNTTNKLASGGAGGSGSGGSDDSIGRSLIRKSTLNHDNKLDINKQSFVPLPTTTQTTNLLPKHHCQLSSSPYGPSTDGRKLSLGSINPQSYRPSLPHKTTTAHASDGEEFEFHDRSSPFYTDRWAGKTIRHFDSDLYSNANLFKSMIL